MKDANAILEKAEKIRKTVPGATITLETTAPVCSKSTKFFSDNGIEVKCNQSSRIKMNSSRYNYVRTHFTTKEVPAVSLGLIEKGLNFKTLFSIQYA